MIRRSLSLTILSSPSLEKVDSRP